MKDVTVLTPTSGWAELNVLLLKMVTVYIYSFVSVNIHFVTLWRVCVGVCLFLNLNYFGIVSLLQIKPCMFLFTMEYHVRKRNVVNMTKKQLHMYVERTRPFYCVIATDFVVSTTNNLAQKRPLDSDKLYDFIKNNQFC